MHRFSIMRMAVLASAACYSAVSAEEASADSAAVIELVRKFGEAQRNPDPVILRALTSTQFIEISPLGDVDRREKMIAFYVKDLARIPPQVTIDEQIVRVFGDSAIVNLRLTMNVNGQARSLRSSYVAHKEGAEWKMVSAQHTPMRPAKP